MDLFIIYVADVEISLSYMIISHYMRIVDR